MKHYFLVAKDVGNLTRIFCASLEAKHLKDAPTLSRMIGKFLPRGRKSGSVHKDFMLESGRITLANDDAFAQDPVNLLRIFQQAGRPVPTFTRMRLHAVRLNLRKVDEKLRRIRRRMRFSCHASPRQATRKRAPRHE